MSEPIDILDSYADSFRDLINARVWQKRVSPKVLLRLNDDSDWNFICVAMDVVGDASLAVRHFLRFSLDGPTRYEDVGERYLRLYGVLSAAYVQQRAILKLFKLMNCPDPANVQKQFDALEITRLRHQLASHSTDFLAHRGGTTQAFVPVRIGLAGFSCMVTENRGGPTRTIDLKEALLAHCKVATSVLDRLYQKAMKTLFKGQQQRLAEFHLKLKDLRFVRDGNTIIRAGMGKHKMEIRMVFVKPRLSRDSSGSA